MKQLNNVTLVNGLSEIYQLFTQLYPELVPQVKEWYQLDEYTDTSRGLVIHLHNDSKLLFSVHKFDDEEGWCVQGCRMVPSYVKEIPENAMGSTPAGNIGPTDQPEELLDIFCLQHGGMFSRPAGSVFRSPCSCKRVIPAGWNLYKDEITAHAV